MGATPIDCLRVKKHNSFMNSFTHESIDKLKSHGCSNKLSLDQGYRAYYIDVASTGQKTYRHPIIIFASIYKFPAPAWAAGMNENELYEKWRPGGN
jgi:hypothetical protein